MEKTLPQAIIVEQSLLAALLLDPDKMAEVVDILSPKDFYRNSHRLIFGVMCEQYAAGEAFNCFTVVDELERRHQIADAEGEQYVLSLVGEFWSVSPRTDATLITTRALQRHIIQAAGQIAAIGQEGGDPESMLQKAAGIIEQVSERKQQAGLTPLFTFLEPCQAEIERAHSLRHAVIGVPTGFVALDQLLGGLQPSDLILLAGRPSMGKTSCGLTMACNAAKAGKQVAVFSLEMGARQLVLRLVAAESGIPTTRLRNGWIYDGEWEKITGASDALASLPLYIDDTSGSPVVSMKAKLRRLERELKRKTDLVVVDYLGLMTLPDEDANKRENRVQEVTQISAGLKGLAKEFDIPVLALAQLSRAVESRQSKIPQLSDLRDSGSLEQDADIVIFVYRDDYYAGKDKDGKSLSDRPGIADLIIAKHRNGEMGEIALAFDASRTHFSDLPDIVEGSAA